MMCNGTSENLAPTSLNSGPASSRPAVADVAHDSVELGSTQVQWRIANAQFLIGECGPRASSVSKRIETGLQILDLTRFLDANRSPPRIKSGAGFCLKTRYPPLPPITARTVSSGPKSSAPST